VRSCLVIRTRHCVTVLHMLSIINDSSSNRRPGIPARGPRSLRCGIFGVESGYRANRLAPAGPGWRKSQLFYIGSRWAGPTRSIRRQKNCLTSRNRLDCSTRLPEPRPLRRGEAVLVERPSRRVPAQRLAARRVRHGVGAAQGGHPILANDLQSPERLAPASRHFLASTRSLSRHHARAGGRRVQRSRSGDPRETTRCDAACLITQSRRFS